MKALMGSIAAANASSSGTTGSSSNGLTDLLQTLTNENSPLLSTLSSPSIQTALENAPASDIVEISDQAMQLQATDALFGITSSSDSPTDNLFSALADSSSGTGSSALSSSLDPGSSLADQLAAYQGNMQTQEAQTLLGNNSTPNSLFDVFA
jgi:hypothetical protein